MIFCAEVPDRPSDINVHIVCFTVIVFLCCRFKRSQMVDIKAPVTADSNRMMDRFQCCPVGSTGNKLTKNAQFLLVSKQIFVKH